MENCFILLKTGAIICCTGKNVQDKCFYGYNLESKYLRHKTYKNKKIEKIFEKPTIDEMSIVIKKIKSDSFYFLKEDSLYQGKEKTQKKLRAVWTYVGTHTGYL